MTVAVLPRRVAEPERTEAERHRDGAALRRGLARREQARWSPTGRRTDPVAILLRQGETRLADLLPERYRRMSASPFSFYRGAAAIMAQDLSGLPHAGIRVQSCGDAHLLNFGTFASPEDVAVFDINDFDETLAAPFEWDVKRLATSLVLAGREAGLKPSACVALARRCAASYRRHVRRLSLMSPLAAWNSRIDLREAIARIDRKPVRHRAERRLERVLAEASSGYGLFEQQRDGSWQIARRTPFVRPLAEHELHAEAAFARYAETLREEQRLLYERYRLRATALKVVGIGSVGTLCAIALFTTADASPLLLQMKEAQESALVAAGATPFANQGQRVVAGQRIMQAVSDPFLGWTEARVDGRQLYVRRLKDSRLASVGTEIESETLPFTAALCGRTLARAHLRSGDGALLSGYLGGGEVFDDAIAAFAEAYARQNDEDFASFRTAIQQGVIRL